MYAHLPDVEQQNSTLYPHVGPQQFAAVATSPPVPHQRQPPTHNTAIRTWEKNICCCCGSCDERGWFTFLLGLFVPCVLFGKVRQRAFGESCFSWGLLFFILLMLGIVSLRTIDCSHTRDSREIEDPTCEIHVFNVVFFSGSRQLLNMLGSLGSLCILVLIVMGALTRCRIRRKFALPGTDCEDCLMWTCCIPCSLCQESRTLQLNNVENGEWYGTMWPVGAPRGTHVRVPSAQYQAPVQARAPFRPFQGAPPAPGVPLLHAEYATSTV